MMTIQNDGYDPSLNDLGTPVPWKMPVVVSSADVSWEATPHCVDDGTPGVTREKCPWHPAADTSDTGYTLLALADDWITEHSPDDGEVDTEDVYDWLVAQGRKLGAR